MNSEIRDALNEHIKMEFQAWYEYAAMSLWFEDSALPGFAAFMERQSDEELQHARRMIDHLMERDEKPVLPALDQPRASYESVREALQHVLEAERRVSASIRNLHKLAGEKDDQAARIMLEWFISEQVEEENMARTLLDRLKLAGDTGPGLFLLDQEVSRIPQAEPPAA